MREHVVPKQAKLGSKNFGFRAVVYPRRERENGSISKDSVVIKVSMPFIIGTSYVTKRKKKT
jgi:hypothetical protein